MFGGIRTLCFRYAAQAKPQAQAWPTTPSTGARVQVKPHAGGEAPDPATVAPQGRCCAGSQGAGADGSGGWCLLFVLIRHGEEGVTSLHAGLERLGEETGEPFK